MLAKKVTALFVSAALALSLLLTGCGGGKALSQVIADLLSNLYDNVAVEVDSDLTAALKKAAAEGGTEDEILTALVNNLNLSGVSISFHSLDDGQQGEHGVTVTFQTGSDPDAAARNALAQWASVFGSLPDDGSYRAHVSMIEGDNGYYIAVDVEVLKAGTPDKGETDPDPEPDPGYRVENGAYFVTNVTGLIAWADHVRAGHWDTNCTLEEEANIDLKDTGNWEPIGTVQTPYTGTFNGNGKTITGLTIDSSSRYVGMFGYLKGEVTKLTLASVSITSSWSDKTYAAVGAVAGYITSSSTINGCSVSGSITINGANSNAGGLAGQNYGSISNCWVNGLTIKGPSSNGRLGGVVGSNSKTIEDCHVENLIITDGANAGGVVGYNTSTSTLTGCSVKGSSVTGSSISGGVVGNFSSGEVAGCSVESTTVATDGKFGTSGGVIGSQSNGTAIACYFANGSINNTGADMPKLGGVAGAQTGGRLIACYSTGGGDLDISTSAYAGGVVGNKSSSSNVTACYWSGQQTNAFGSSSLGGGNATHVTNNGDGDTVTWAEALKELNGSSNISGYQFDGTMDAPSLSKKTTVTP